MTRLGAIILSVGLSSAIASAADAAQSTIDWLNYTPYVMNDSTSAQPTLPTGQTFNLPGVGNVRVDFTTPSSAFSGFRGNAGGIITGSVTSGPDTYSWSDHEDFRRVNLNNLNTIAAWSVTYTFLDGPVAAGNLVLGVQGLGRLDLNFPGNITTASVARNGTYLGEFGLSSNLGPNQFTGGAGSFSLRNALPGNTSAGNPAFNTRLAIVRIDDTISSLTVNFNQIGQDGVGVNIGVIPTPSPVCDSIDFNGDGLFPDDADLVDFLSVLAGGPCTTGTCNDIDFNNDELFPDDSDLIAFLRVLAGGAC